MSDAIHARSLKRLTLYMRAIITQMLTKWFSVMSVLTLSRIFYKIPVLSKGRY